MMAAAPGLDAQRAVRMQAEELDEYMKELFSWSKDMKGKRAGAGRAEPAVRGGEAPVRLAAEAAPLPPVKAAASSGGTSSTQPPASKHPAAHTYENYRAKWENFDVDAALASDDEEGGSGGPGSGGGKQPGSGAAGSASAPRSTTHGGGNASTPMDIPQARVTVPVAATGAVPAPGSAAPTSADGWKDAGNAHFKKGKYQQAADCYTRSLEMQPACLAYANRAMARLKLGQAEGAEADCSEAVRMDPLYVKAYQRRATARKQLGQVLRAVEDCEWVLRLEPNNKQAAADRAAWVAELLQQEGLPLPSRFEALPVVLAGAPNAEAAIAEAHGVAPPAARPVQHAPAPPAPAAASMGADSEAHIRVASTVRHKSAATAGEVETVASRAAVAPAAAVATIQVISSSSTGGEMEEDVDEVVPDLQPRPAPNEAKPPVAMKDPAMEQQAQPAAAPTQQPPMQAAERAAQLAAAAPPPAQAAVAPAMTQATLAQPSALQAGSTSPTAQAASAVGGAAPPVQAPATPAAEPTTGAARGQEQPPTAAAATPAVPVVAQAPLRVPRTGVEFEKGWKACKGDPQRQAAFLLALQPASLPALLKQALTPALLASSAGVLLNPGLAQQPAVAVALLAALPDVPRFSLNLLSVPGRQRAELGVEWDRAATGLAPGAGAGGGAGGHAELAVQLAAARQRWKF